MKKFIKIFLILLFLMTFSNTSFAEKSEEVIFLNASEVTSLKVPVSPVVDYAISNQDYEYKHQKELEISGDFSSEEELSNNKVLNSFYKFVDNKLINNKLNDFTYSLVDDTDE